MVKRNEYVDYLLELLEPWATQAQAEVSARAMFGGHGIYRDGTMFALVAEGVLYFKVTDANRPAYEQADSHALYVRETRQVIRDVLLVRACRRARRCRSIARLGRSRLCHRLRASKNQEAPS